MTTKWAHLRGHKCLPYTPIRVEKGRKRKEEVCDTIKGERETGDVGREGRKERGETEKGESIEAKEERIRRERKERE